VRFDFFEHGFDGFRDIAFEEVPNRHRVNDDGSFEFGILSREFFATLSGGAGDERNAIHHRHEHVVVPRNGSFAKDHERAPGGDQDVDRCVDGFAIEAFAVDAERSHAAEHEALKAILFEQMP
jgi:hypothetical protein